MMRFSRETFPLLCENYKLKTCVKKEAMRRYCNEASNSILTWSFSTLMHASLNIFEYKASQIYGKKALLKCRLCLLVVFHVVCLGGIGIGDAAAGADQR
jgi:hypothetical protein